jgi:hypothetical protein
VDAKAMLEQPTATHPSPEDAAAAESAAAKAAIEKAASSNDTNVGERAKAVLREL